MAPLVGGRDHDDERPAPRGRALLVLLAAALAAGAAVGVPLLLTDGGDPDDGAVLGAAGWEGATVCRTEPEGGCVELGAGQAERLAEQLLPLEPVAEDLVTCMAVGERYAVRLRGAQEVPELTVDTQCGPLLAGGERYRLTEEARAAVATAWTGG